LRHNLQDSVIEVSAGGDDDDEDAGGEADGSGGDDEEADGASSTADNDEPPRPSRGATGNLATPAAVFGGRDPSKLPNTAIKVGAQDALAYSSRPARTPAAKASATAAEVAAEAPGKVSFTCAVC
jgi:hypothetical protein